MLDLLLLDLEVLSVQVDAACFVDLELSVDDFHEVEVEWDFLDAKAFPDFGE